METMSSKGYSLYKFKYFLIFFSFKYLTFDWKTESLVVYKHQTNTVANMHILHRKSKRSGTRRQTT